MHFLFLLLEQTAPVPGKHRPNKKTSGIFVSTRRACEPDLGKVSAERTTSTYNSYTPYNAYVDGFPFIKIALIKYSVGITP